MSKLYGDLQFIKKDWAEENQFFKCKKDDADFTKRHQINNLIVEFERKKRGKIEGLGAELAMLKGDDGDEEIRELKDRVMLLRGRLDYCKNKKATKFIGGGERVDRSYYRSTTESFR